LTEEEEKRRRGRGRGDKEGAFLFVRFFVKIVKK